jgi:hypothetical protein
MTPDRIALLVRAVWLVSFLCIVMPLAATDWRLGSLAAGILLGVSNTDWRRA